MKDSKKEDQEQYLTKSEAYVEIYEALKTEISEGIREKYGEHLNKGMKLKAETLRKLMIPRLEELGLTDLEKISDEADKINAKTSKLSANDREVVFNLCAVVAFRYRVLINKITLENEEADNKAAEKAKKKTTRLKKV